MRPVSRVEIEAVDDPVERVGEIEVPVVEAPHDRVGDADAVEHPGDGEIGIDPEERRAVLLQPVVHRARPRTGRGDRTCPR